MDGNNRDQQGLSRLGVFLTLAVGFLLAFGTGASLLFQTIQKSQNESTVSHLKTVAQISASQIDADSVQNLNSPDQIESSDYVNLIGFLDSVVAADPSITHISVLKQIGPQYCYLADATSLGEGKSKSNLLDPAEFVPTGLIKAVTHAAPEADTALIEDRWGTWYSGFAPVLDSEDKVVAVVQVDTDAEAVNAQTATLTDQLHLIGCVIAIGLVGLAWLVSATVYRGLSDPIALSNAAKRQRIVQILVFAAVIGIGLEATQTYMRQNQLHVSYTESTRLHKAKQELISAYEEIEEGREVSGEGLERLVTTLKTSHNADMADRFRAFSHLPERTQEASPLKHDLEKLDHSISELDIVEQDLMDSQSLANKRLLASILVLGLIAVILSRSAANLDFRIQKTVKDSHSLQAQLTSMVENLPIGMFTLQNGEVGFCNAEWRYQTGAHGHTTLESLAQSIHPDDREGAIQIIAESSRIAAPFDVSYRIKKEGSPIMHVETRGVPVYDKDGICRHMIAFTVDLSATVEAKEGMVAAYDEVANKNRLLSDAMAELEHNLESVVRALVKAVEAKDPYTAGHSERVMQYSLWLGEAIGLGPYELRILELGTLVHDVGKIGIPDAILTKPDRLTDEEYAIIKKHPEYGVNIIGNIDLFRECIPIVKWHHERLDGKGYPDGLKGEEIPVMVRISAIADMFDAMTSTRAYRQGMALDKVLEIMNDVAERGEIDAELFATFCQVIHNRGIIAQKLRPEPWKAA